MKILQIIDSLRSGGAEKMAVSYANALARGNGGSYLCCTRQEGVLKKSISSEVGYLFLQKKHSLDLHASKKLVTFIKSNNIELLHAHSTSWFLAVLVKWSYPKVKIIWHDHYGQNLEGRGSFFLKLFSSYFDGIIAVNSDLKMWSEKNLKVSNVQYFRNFLPENELTTSKKIILRGKDTDFKILCVANFRPQKDHLNLLLAFQRVLEVENRVSLHLIGKRNDKDYSEKIKSFIADHKLSNKIFLYGEQAGVKDLLHQADLGVLSSNSEGLPVVLLEYGKAGLPVVATSVGAIPEVVGNNGLLVPPRNPKKLATALLEYIQNSERRKRDSSMLQKKVHSLYAEESVIPGVITFYETTLYGDNVN